MSTRSAIKYDRDDTTGTGFHLFLDWLDECAGADVVHLRLDGVSFEASCSGGIPTVEVTLPREMAEKLGLLAPVADQSVG